MKTFTVYIKHNEDLDDDVELVPEGFNIFAAFLQVFWAVYHKIWAVSLVLLFINIALMLIQKKEMFSSEALSVLNIALFVFIGYLGNDLRRKNLEKKGYVFSDVVIAKNIDEARQRFYDLGYFGA